MRILLVILLAIASFGANAQAVIADPALGQITIAAINNENLTVLPPSFPIDIVYILKVPVQNLSSNSIPPGSCKIKVGLGSKIVLDPTFNLINANTSNYFHWTIIDEGGQYELTGDGFGLIPIPPMYSDTATFLVKGSILGGSTLTATFLATNHNTPVSLSDNNGANNTTSQFYIITPTVPGPLPVTFSGLFLKKENCNIDVRFTTENEINLHHYEVEYASDGRNFITAGNVLPNSLKKYTYKLNIPTYLQKGNVFVRIKSIDNDGRFQYSEIKMIKEICDEKSNVLLFPNPVVGKQTFVTIKNSSGQFPTGKYIVSLYDFNGRNISSMQQTIVNAAGFNYNISPLAAGNYLLRIVPITGELKPISLQFQKHN